jgi:hypothetical protein
VVWQVIHALAAGHRFVIPTGAYPDFLLRSTTSGRMKFANATKPNRKSGVAKWRDLRFALQV